MTQEENWQIANDIVGEIYGDPWPEFADAIAQALAAREAETVERCAKVADAEFDYATKKGFSQSWMEAAEKIASALRATLKPETKGAPL